MVNFDLLLCIFIDFSMSNAMQEHASTVEQLIPDFAALRQRLCNSMNEKVFWMVYFILLVPRLHGHDSELLSNPKVIQLSSHVSFFSLVFELHFSVSTMDSLSELKVSNVRPSLTGLELFLSFHMSIRLILHLLWVVYFYCLFASCCCKLEVSR